MFSVYNEVFKTKGMPRLIFTNFLVRLGTWMWGTALVLFTLDTFGSPELAGLAVLLNSIFGVLLGPFSGAIIDNFNKEKVIVFSLFMTSLMIFLIPLFSFIGFLPEWLFLIFVILAGSFRPLAMIALFTLIPLLIPDKIWDQANAIDGISQEMAVVISQLIIGFTAAFINSDLGVIFVAFTSLFSIFILDKKSIKEVGAKQKEENTAPTFEAVVKDTINGFKYVLSNSRLRGLSISVPFYVATFGILTVTIPILVIERLGVSEMYIGILWGIEGVAAIISNLVFGRFSTKNREKLTLGSGMAISLIGFGLLGFTQNVYFLLIGLILIGGTQGIVDISLNSLKQRSTEPEWYGRAFSVFGTFISLGGPIGGGIAGLIVAHSLNVALLLPFISGLIALVILMILVRSTNEVEEYDKKAMNN